MDYPEGIDEKFMEALFFAASTESGSPAPVRDIQTWEKIGEIPCSTLENAMNSLNHARARADSWEQLSGYKRALILQRLLRRISRHREQIIALSQVISGKSLLDATEEYVDMITMISGLKRGLKHIIKPRRGSGSVPLSTYRVQRRPLGVVGMFTSPDYPMSMLCDILNPLMVGNTVVNFVTPQATLGALMMKAIMVDAGMPSDAWRIVVSSTVDLGMTLIPGLDYVLAEGSTETCQRISRECGVFSVPMSFFGPVKNVAIVMEDAKLWDAAKACVRSAFQNAGQAATSLEIVFVQDSVKTDLEELMTAYVRNQLRAGRYTDNRATMGAMLRPGRVKRTDALIKAVADNGGRILVGSHPRPEISPTFFEPTILSDVPLTQAFMNSELYGPAFAVLPFHDVLEVAKALTLSNFMSSVYLFTKDMAFVKDFIATAHASTVSINDTYTCLYGTWEAPIQGRMESGRAIRHGVEAANQFTRKFSASRLKKISWVPKDWRTGNWTERLTFTFMGMYSWLSRNVTDTVVADAFKSLWRHLTDKVTGPV